jgi:hypothetical protein
MQQNRALHLYFKNLALELNLAGLTIQEVVKHKMEMDWTPESVKELLWRPAQLRLLGKRSTTELLKHEDIDLIWEHLNRHLGEKLGIYVPFPSAESEEAQAMGYLPN